MKSARFRSDYVYVYINVFRCISVCIYTCIQVYLRMYIYTYSGVSLFASIHVFRCISVCMYTRIQVYLLHTCKYSSSICVHITARSRSLHMYVCIHVFRCIYIHVNLHHVYAYTCLLELIAFEPFSKPVSQLRVSLY